MQRTEHEIVEQTKDHNYRQTEADHRLPIVRTPEAPVDHVLDASLKHPLVVVSPNRYLALKTPPQGRYDGYSAYVDCEEEYPRVWRMVAATHAINKVIYPEGNDPEGKTKAKDRLPISPLPRVPLIDSLPV
jgi:hypothetical protein